MSFRRHKNCIDSGVAWLGDVPSHWDVVRLRRLVEIKKDIAGELGYDVFSVTQNGFRIKDTESGEGQQSLDYSKYQFVKVGQFGMNPMDLLTGGADIATTVGVTSPDYRVFEIRHVEVVHDRYMLYMLQMLYRNHIFYAFGQGSSQLGRWRLPRQQFNDLQFPVPPLDEQKAISSFLDVETSKIDGLVSEQRRLIELLKEKRQAVISHAVTKGLNLNAPMKPSGIQWLGDVPQHWEIKRLSRVGRLQNGLNIGGDAFGSGDPFVSYGDVYKNANVPEMPSGLVQSTQDDQVKCSLEVGDVLFTRTSETVDDIGVASTCLCGIPRSTFAGFLIRLRPNAGILDPQYSTYLFRNQGVQGHFSGTMNMVTRASLSQDVLKMLPICIPPINEQGEIAAFIQEKVELFRGLIAEAERAVELLQERRTALISAAVTGKIDVRGVIETAAP